MEKKRYKYDSAVRFIMEELLPGLRPGDLLPSPDELCRLTGVSMITVTRALRILGESGHVRRIKNKGTVVLPPPEKEKAEPETPDFAGGGRILRVAGIHPYSWNLMKIIKHVFEDFTAYRPEIRFQVEYPPVLQLADALAENDYDLIFVNTALLREIATTPLLREKILPLDDLKGLYFRPDDFHPAPLRECRDGRGWHTVPLTAGPSLQLLNPRYPGLENGTPALPRHWNDYWKYLHSLQQEKRPVFYLNMSLTYLEPMLRMHNLPLFSEDGRRCELDRPETVALFRELCHRCGREKLILPSTSGQEGDTLAARGNIFQALGLKWTSMVDFAAGQEKWRVAALPEAEQRAAHLFIEGVMVGRDAPRQAVAEFLNFLQSAGVQAQLAGCSGPVCRLDLLPWQLARLEPFYQGLGTAFAEGMECARPFAMHSRARVVSIVTEYLAAICNNLIAPETGCKAAAEKANAMLKESDFLP